MNTAKKKIPSWPKERDLKTYGQYTRINFNENFTAKIWMDIGCRTGKALSQSRKFFQAKLIGVNAHKIPVRNGIQAILAEIPKDLTIYKSFRQKIDLVTDIYAAVSYAEDPLDAMIYEASLLKTDGKCVIVTLQGRIKGPAAWKRIKTFLDQQMNISVSLKSFITYSDKRRSPIKTLRITLNKQKKANPSLQNLFAQARIYVGEMTKDKILWEATDKSAKIWMVKYKISPEETATAMRRSIPNRGIT